MIRIAQFKQFGRRRQIVRRLKKRLKTNGQHTAYDAAQSTPQRIEQVFLHVCALHESNGKHQHHIADAHEHTADQGTQASALSSEIQC